MRREATGKGGLLLALMLAALCAAPVGAWAAEPVRMVCAPTLLPLMERTAQALAEGASPLDISLSEADSAQAVQALLAGDAGLAGLSRLPWPLEEAQARGKGLALTSQRLGTDCLLTVVHPSNPVMDLTLAELRGIFSGRIRNWKEVGGKDKSIMVVVRPASSGAAQVWLALALDRIPPRADASEQESHQEVIQAVAGNKAAIGYLSLGFLDPSVKALSLGGVNPGLANVRAGRYPVCRPLMLLGTDRATPGAQVVLEFLASPPGQELVRVQGFLPLK